MSWWREEKEESHMGCLELSWILSAFFPRLFWILLILRFSETLIFSFISPLLLLFFFLIFFYYFLNIFSMLFHFWKKHSSVWQRCKFKLQVLEVNFELTKMPLHIFFGCIEKNSLFSRQMHTYNQMIKSIYLSRFVNWSKNVGLTNAKY